MSEREHHGEKELAAFIRAGAARRHTDPRRETGRRRKRPSVAEPNQKSGAKQTSDYTAASMTAREMKGRYVSEKPSSALNLSLWARRTRSTRS